MHDLKLKYIFECIDSSSAAKYTCSVPIKSSSQWQCALVPPENQITLSNAKQFDLYVRDTVT